jgi:hypothetical protein
LTANVLAYTLVISAKASRENEMQVMENGSRVQYYDPQYGYGTVTRHRISGAGPDAEAEYLIRWDEDPDGEGPTWSWWNEIVAA